MTATANLHSTVGQLRVLHDLDRARLVAAAADDTPAVRLYRDAAMAAADTLARRRIAYDAAIGTGDTAAAVAAATRDAVGSEAVAWTPVVMAVHALARGLLDTVARELQHPGSVVIGHDRMDAMMAAYRESEPTPRTAGG